jgi:hypothetical protein
MLSIFTASSAKKSARSLELFMKAKGYELKLGEALDALGVMSGKKNWAALSQTLTTTSVDERLQPKERNHIWDAQEADLRAEETGEGGYARECSIQTHTGFMLKTPAYPEDCSYVRVCDPLGRETFYWASDEWEQDPEVVMGAIMGALNRLPGIDTTIARELPLIKDVDFNFVSNVLVDGAPLRVFYREEDTLAELLSTKELDEVESDAKVALTLERHTENGFVRHESISLLTLLQLTWDEKKTSFVSPDGTTYEFFVERKFGV